MKQLSAALAFFTLFGAHKTFSHGSSQHELEDLDPISSMVPLPIRIGTDGDVQWGYHIDFEGGHHHGGHSGHGSMHSNEHTDMNHGGMHSSDDYMGMGQGDMHSSDNNMGMNHDDMHSSDNNMEMNHDDMSSNDSDTNHSDEDHKDEERHSRSHGGEHDEWMFMVMPMLTLGGDYYTKVINLTEDKNNDNILEIDDTSKGFIGVQNKSIVAGAGVGIMAMPPTDIPMFSFKLNLMPYKGGHVFRLKHLENEKQLDTIGQMKIPNTLSDLDKWSINDRMSYSSRGGVMFGAGFGFSVLANFMQTYMAEGSWVTTVSKAGKSSVLVSLRKSHMKMFAKKAMNMLVELSTSEMKHIDQNFNFIFDLSSESALKAYQRMLNGDLLFAQECIINKVNGVEFVQLVDSNTLGFSKRVNIGLPFLYNFRKVSGGMETVSNIHHGFTGDKYLSHMSMYKKAVESDGILSDHRDSGTLFMGMVSEKLNSNSPEIGFMGTFKWYFKRSNTSNAYFNGQLHRLYSQFGFEKAKEIRVPTLKNMGFVKAQVDVNYGVDELKTLFENSKKTGFKSDLKESVLKNMNEFFKWRKNYRAICGKVGVLKRCKARYYSRTRYVLDELPRSISQMRKHLNNKNYKEFSKAFGRFGKLSITNRFVLHGVFDFSGVEDIKTKLNIQGSRILKTSIEL